MATFNEDGEIHTRPMAIKIRQDLVEPYVYFYIRNSSQVGQEIRLKDYIHLGYMDETTHLYVTFKGKGAIKQDEQLKQQLWTPMMKTWFPEGLDDPQLGLVEVKLEEAQIWDSVSARVITLGQLHSSPTSSAGKDSEGPQTQVPS